MHERAPAIAIAAPLGTRIEQFTGKLHEPLRLLVITGGQAKVTFDAADMAIANQIAEEGGESLLHDFRNSTYSPLGLTLRKCKIDRRLIFRQRGGDRFGFANPSPGPMPQDSPHRHASVLRNILKI